MLIYADSIGTHHVKHTDLNNPQNNNIQKKAFKLRLKKNGHDFADVEVNDNGHKYYTKFNNLQNFFHKLNNSNNSLFELAKKQSKKKKKKFKQKL